MSERHPGNDRRLEPTGAASPTWWIVFSRELQDLWIGGKALYLILIYAVLLGIYSYLFASNSELNLLPLKQMVLEIVKAAIAVGLFICLIIGADSFSGERERATLEGLLLTPTSRRQIALGKFLAAVSPWPVAVAIAVPYWIVLSKGDAALVPALLWGPVLGSLLAPAFAGVGMLVSVWCNSNKTSMLVSLALYLLLIFPAEFSALAQTGPLSSQTASRSDVLQWVNPIAASGRFLHDTIMGNSTVHQLWLWVTTPVLFPVVVLGVLFAFAGPKLRLEAGTGRLWRTPT